MKAFSLILILCWLQLSALGASVELEVWKPTASGPRLILPIPKGSDPKVVAAHYLEVLFHRDALSDLVDEPWLEEAKGSFSALPAGSKKPRFGLIDNAFEPRRSEIKAFTSAGADAYLIPLAAELALDTAAERTEFRALIAKRLDALVALGGDDVDPGLYGEKITYAEDTNPARDRIEASLIRAFLKEKHGVLYGICRGHELIAAILGYKLYQDLAKETGIHGHEEGRHSVTLTDGSLLQQFVDGKSEITVNSYHHEAVHFHARGKLFQSAVAGEGEGDEAVTEALESRDGSVVTFQFHPELMKSETGRSILRGMVEHAGER